ncbi:GNAT family N-acetyltransferase [Allosediminivita pacifica]|uniref:Acetyltransferase (GNAT) family protein n=1 Tax=Allosediminivita pacifica TaxID=1267769 RepID=A0A2T6ADB6_9RHOB|nr:GNAT family N-acetyltransferase [Allosediminivita pacifica]PTX41766.1 acetyltransferase (GNAT) family protein [Allosediminivita pacifica]GGB22698.1 N-acetyltransferase [Allosediminivita pacifica]
MSISILASDNPGASTSADPAFRILPRAFENDPPIRWLLPDDESYRIWFPELVQALGGTALRDDTLTRTPGGVALWSRPGAETNDAALEELVRQAVPEARHAEVFAVFEQMGRHAPGAPHWYLPFIGVLPERQGEGLGTALMLPILGTCDTTGTSAYLEASTPASRALYARLGFETVAEIRVGTCPPIFPMVRPPARPSKTAPFSHLA